MFRERVKKKKSPQIESKKNPVPFIKKISQQGDLVINFTEDVITVPDLAFINDTTLLIEVQPGEDSDPAKLLLEWEVVWQTSRQLSIKLKFQDALFVSANIQPDFLKIVILDPVVFTAINGLQVEPENLEILKAIPSQLGVKQETVQKALDKVTISTESLTYIEFTSHILLRIPLN